MPAASNLIGSIDHRSRRGAINCTLEEELQPLVTTNLPPVVPISREELSLLHALLGAEVSSTLEAESLVMDKLKNATPTKGANYDHTTAE